MSSPGLTACGISRINHSSSVVESAALTSPSAFDLDNGAWTVTNWDQVLSRSIRGSDLLIPGVAGLLPRERTLDILEASLNMVFDGNVDKAGTSYNPNTVMHGLEKNRQDFIANAVEPPATTDNLFAITLTLLDGATVSGDLHVEDFKWSYSGVPGIARAVWSVSITDGKLT